MRADNALARRGCTVNVLLTVHAVLKFPGQRITSVTVKFGGEGWLVQENGVPEFGGAKTV